MNKSPIIWTLIAFFGAAVMVACQTDLHVEERAFRCSDESDCLPDYNCVSLDAKSAVKQCVRGGTRLDASDAISSDAITSDATRPDVSDADATVPDAPTPDTSSIDAGNDAVSDADTDASECSTAQPCADGHCVDGQCMQGCRSNDHCPSETCSASNCMCENDECVSATFSSVRIKDNLGSGEAQCSNQDPGVDIFAARLTNLDGSTIFGRVLSAQLNGVNNIHTDTSVIDNASITTCAEPDNAPAFVSLGCQGELSVEFENSDGQIVELVPGMELLVAEFGTSCGDVQNSEHYGFALCTTTDPADCPVTIVHSHTGNVTVTLSEEAQAW